MQQKVQIAKLQADKDELKRQFEEARSFNQVRHRLLLLLFYYFFLCVEDMSLSFVVHTFIYLKLTFRIMQVLEINLNSKSKQLDEEKKHISRCLPAILNDLANARTHFTALFF